jgi:hypothetical protein
MSVTCTFAVKPVNSGGPGRGTALEWVPVQTPSLRHAFRMLLITVPKSVLAYLKYF